MADAGPAPIVTVREARGVYSVSARFHVPEPPAPALRSFPGVVRERSASRCPHGLRDCSGSLREIPQSLPSFSPDTRPIARESIPGGLADAGARLALPLLSIDMFRAAVLSIVLALAAGTSASALCGAWCHQAGAARTCEHQDSTGARTVAATDLCPGIAGLSTAYVREDVRRGASTPRAQHARNVAPFESGPPPIAAELVLHAAHRTPLAARPLVLSLRI